MITGTPCAGNLVDSRLKELLPPLPVIYVKAVPVQVKFCRKYNENLDSKACEKHHLRYFLRIGAITPQYCRYFAFMEAEFEEKALPLVSLQLCHR